MSDLNLVPNPQLMLVQTVVFLSQVYVVKKLFIAPFLKLKALRSNATVGADTKSEELRKEITVLSEHVRAQLSKTQDEIKKLKETQKNEANKVRETDLTDAYKQMSELVSTSRKNIQVNLQEERKKIGGLADKFVEEIYAKILH